MLKTELVWPHEADVPPLSHILGELLFPHNTTGRVRVASLRKVLRQIVVNIVSVYLLGKPDPFPGFREEFMELFNNKKAAFLANKYLFVETVHRMKRGYRTPRQVLIPVHQEPEAARIVNEISSWNVEKIYVKPVSGDNARGIGVMFLGEVTEALGNLKEDSIFQEAMPFVKEFRYAISWGSDGVVRRFCFEKVRPILIGDGRSPLWHLIVTQPQMTIRSKWVTLVRRLKELRRVIPKGEQYATTVVANPPRGSFERVVDDPKVMKQLDGFILQFVDDLEQSIRVESLRLLCFDVGVLDYPSAKLGKDNIVFIECQMPFSAIVYFWRHPHSLASFLYFYSSTFR